MSSGKRIAILAGLGGLLLYLTRPSGTVVTSETFDLLGGVAPTTASDKIRRFALAIARQEGFYQPGSLPQRAHNPGDLNVPGLPTVPGTLITQFTDDGAGWAALYRQLAAIVSGSSSYYSLDMTIDDMARVWTATQQDAWSRNVASDLGVSPFVPLWQVLA